MSTPPNYQEFSPGAALAGRIECFWTSESDSEPGASSFNRVLPDGCMDLLFDFTNTDRSRASVIGTMSRPHTFTMSGRADLLGVRFRPGGLSGLFPMSAAELTDSRADLEDLWGQVAREAWHRMAEAGTEARIPILRQVLDACSTKRPDPDLFIRHCVTRIEEAHGNLRIADLEKSTGLSTRQLQRKFAQQLGVSPKTFARIIRFKRVEAAATRPNPPDWIRLATDFGYADQPHLVREFRAFSGLSPVDYLAELKATA